MPAQPKKKPFSKTLTCNSNFSELQVRKKLLQELGEETAIIISNADNSEISPFIKFF